MAFLCSQWLSCYFLCRAGFARAVQTSELHLKNYSGLPEQNRAFVPSKSKSEVLLNRSIWLHWEAHFPSLHQPVKGQQICELQMLILAQKKKHVGLSAWLRRTVLHTEELQAGSLSFWKEMWECLGCAEAGTQAVGSLVGSSTRSKIRSALAAPRLWDGSSTAWGASPHQWDLLKGMGRLLADSSALAGILSFVSCIFISSVWVDSVFTVHKEEPVCPFWPCLSHSWELCLIAENPGSEHKVPLPISNKWVSALGTLVTNFSFDVR